ncbi:MAG: hypothetical protein M1821_008039 [Bathelium mastoideum]|nr:MAG: hypothetical protein M1821_008039 [Bathelium mastoideum]KAI9693085.1 MAG: hypothetical protein M1822_005080 [Bathelium mastoideum]
MYNYPNPGQFGRQPSFGSYPGQPGASPGMPGLGPPPGTGNGEFTFYCLPGYYVNLHVAPGMAAPGVSPPPGMQQAQTPTRPGFPPNFQPPPNINFNAQVIRLGVPGSSDSQSQTRAPGGLGSQQPNPRRAGLGAGQDQQKQMRETMMPLAPPTREEIARTIFIGNITSSITDEDLERILRTAGSLRRWTRAIDADSKPCTFGFAEYEDVESLGTAAEIFKERDIEIPVQKQANGAKKTDGEKAGEDANAEEEGLKKSKLLVVVDENSYKYIEEWAGRKGEEDPTAKQFRLDSAREDLQAVLASIHNAHAHQSNAAGATDVDGDTTMQNGDQPHSANAEEIVTIPLSQEDELSDIPAEMREIVAQEIAAFRDRSNKRDMERLRQEEEMEAKEKARSGGGRINRLASPPLSAPSGPAGGANGIPLGPRDRTVPGAPAGPKAITGVQIPKDYQKGVTFVNGTGLSTTSWMSREDEDDSASDSELERRREDKKNAELEKRYLDQERRWLNRERSRTAAVEREKTRDKTHDAAAETEKGNVAKRLREWNDDVEAQRRTEEYYQDRSIWLRNRASFRAREADLDERDRALEAHERAREHERREYARGLADSFLERQAQEMEARAPVPPTPTIATTAAAPGREPQRFKMSLGSAAAQKAQQAAPRRTVAEVEGLLEDEEEAGETQKRTLVPLKIDTKAEAESLTEEERAQAARQLAQDIPTDKEGLWGWSMQWDYVDDSILGQQLKPFVEKKIVEYLGVQEQMLVDVVEEHIRKRGGPQELVGELEGALDEEAEVLVKKIWRMIIFFSESEKRGLST